MSIGETFTISGIYEPLVRQEQFVITGEAVIDEEGNLIIPVEPIMTQKEPL